MHRGSRDTWRKSLAALVCAALVISAPGPSCYAAGAAVAQSVAEAGARAYSPAAAAAGASAVPANAYAMPVALISPAGGLGLGSVLPTLSRPGLQPLTPAGLAPTRLAASPARVPHTALLPLEGRRAVRPQEGRWRDGAVSEIALSRGVVQGRSLPGAAQIAPVLKPLVESAPRIARLAASVPEATAGGARVAGRAIMDIVLGRRSRSGAATLPTRGASLDDLQGDPSAAAEKFEVRLEPPETPEETAPSKPSVPSPNPGHQVFSPVTAAGQLIAGLLQAGLAVWAYSSGIAYLGFTGWMQYLGFPVLGLSGALGVSALGFLMLALRIGLSRAGEIEEGRNPPMKPPYPFYRPRDVKKILFTPPVGESPVYIPKHAARPLEFHKRLKSRMKGFFAYSVQGLSHFRYVFLEIVTAVRSLLGLSRLVADMYRGNPEVKPFVKKRGKAMMLLQGINIVQAVIGVGTSYIIGALVDAAIGKDAGFAFILAGAAVVISLTNAYLNVVYNWFKNRLNGQTLRDFRVHLFGHVLKLPASFFAKEKPAEVATRITDDVGQTTVKNIDIPAALPYYAAFAVVSGAMMIITSWQTTLLIMVAVPLLGVMSAVYGNKAEKLNESIMTRRARMVGTAERSLSDIRDVRAFSAEDEEKAQYADRADKYLGFALGKERLAAVHNQVMGQLYHFSFYIAVLLIGLFSFIYTGAPSIGQTMAMVGYAGYMRQALNGFLNLYTRYRETTGSAKRVLDYLALKPAVEDAPDAVSPGVLGGAVGFKDVSFAYDDAAPILEDVSFSIKPGQKVSIVGESGMAKSAVLDMLLRLYAPRAGSVSYDGRDAGKLKSRELRSQISILHDQGIWNGVRSVRENLRYGLRREVPDDEIRGALKRAGAGFMLNEAFFPKGLDTRVEESDWRVGPARKRLLEVARALLADPRLVLLDGPESGLGDTEARQVREALQVLKDGRTTVTAEQRIERAEESDLILVLHKGVLVEQGTHDEMLALKGVYYRLWASEAAKKE